MTLQGDHWYPLAPDCPLPSTHRRLEQVHRLWHQALDAYHELDAFLTNLNAAIQALRSVTFMLQSEKAAIPGFDDWYSGRQEELRQDAIMKWLSDARTEVVHRSDLEIASSAHAVIHNNRTHFSVKRELDPSVPTELLAQALANTLPEPFASNKKDLVLALEREWRVPALKATEILHAVAHGYGVLRILVAAAHEKAGSQCPAEAEPPGQMGSLRA